MGSIRNGINGGFSGKAGSVIGSSWRDINYIKGIPKISKKPKSEAQLQQQAKFATVIRTLGPIKDLLNVGFGSQTHGRASGYNMAVKHTLDFAVIGTYPDYEIDYSKVLLTRGSAAKPVAPVATAEPGNLLVNWTSGTNEFNGADTDKVTMVVYDPLNNLFMSGPAGVVRSAEQMSMPMPAAYIGNTVHVYLFLTSLKGKLCNSVYAGSAVVE